MANKPRWKEAIELREEYAKRGIGYCYNDRNRNVYLTILNTPTCVPNVDGCQLTGYLIVYGGVVASRDIDMWVEEVKRQYTMSYKNNDVMMEYLKIVN